MSLLRWACGLAAHAERRGSGGGLQGVWRHWSCKCRRAATLRRLAHCATTPLRLPFIPAQSHSPTLDPCLRISERQTPSGGLNGRPEKLQDVCYSWWALSALSTLGRLAWIDAPALTAFILGCQDLELGGISDRPDDAVDVFHTFFGLAGLSLLGHPGLAPIDPVFALPVTTVTRLNLAAQRLSCA